MQVVRTRAALRAVLADAPRPVGFVPTMGWLHDGHLALVARSRVECATTVASIFVNPRQFGDPADLERYPRNEARDLALLEAAGVDVAFCPPASEVYPEGFATTVAVGGVALPLEGAARPGHFDGVATVVALLFGLVGPDRAYFGRKDFQQVAVVTRMAADLGLPVEVVPCPTVREPDGLALSSRNARLSPAGRAAAPVVRRALLAARDRLAGGERDGEALRRAMRDVLATEPLARAEYVSVAGADDLGELATVPAGRPVLLSMAVGIEGVRLIDNEVVEPAG